MVSPLQSSIDDPCPIERITLRLSRGSASSTELEPAPEAPLAVAGDYVLLRLLGRGGVGQVYLARQSGQDRQVAYKVLTSLGVVDPEALARFHGEARTLARLRHPGIVQIYDSGAYQGSPFIAMEYLPGGSLADKLRVSSLTAFQAAALIATVAEAVGYAHSRGIIHRDLKPSNILLDAENQPRVADFGLARQVVGERDSSQVTRTGTIAGTPGYMSPEQIVGKQKLTPAVDVWSLGVMLYEMITGVLPFPGAEPEQVFANVLRHEPISPRSWQSTVPRDVETICLKCLQKEPERRYANASELADDLLRFLDHEAILARPIGFVAKSVRTCRRNPVVAGLTAATMLTLAVASVISTAFATRVARDRANALAAAQAESVLRRRAETAMAAEQKSRREAEAMTAMLDSLLASVIPGRDALTSLRQEMDKAAQILRTDTGDPLTRARLLYRLALTRQNLGDFRDAVPLMEQALAIRTEVLGPNDALTRETIGALSYAYVAAGRGQDALRTLEPVAYAYLAEIPENSPEAIEMLEQLSVAYESAGQYDDADATNERLVSICEKLYGPDHETTHWRRMNLRRYTVPAGRFEEAIPVLRKAYAKFQSVCEPHATPLICARAELGRLLLANGQAREALPYLKEMYESSVARVGATHPFSAIDRNDLAKAYEACGCFAEAIPHRLGLFNHYRKAGDIKRSTFQSARLSADLAAFSW
jgi:tetratricopeptide (TPR) repeat protein